MEKLSFSITNFKVFDSGKFKNYEHLRMERMVSVYEFEFYTEDCEGGHWLDGVYYPVKKGMCFLAKPGQNMRTVFPYKCSFLDIRTDSPELMEAFDKLPSNFAVLDQRRIVEYIHTMVALENPHTIVGQLQLKSYACRIIARMMRYCRDGHLDQRGTILHQQNLLRVDAYMRDHLAEDLSVRKLAQMCNLDPTYFHKLYTGAFGMTPAKRLLQFRINAAKRLLLTGENSLEDVAAQCGFSSQSYFCYRFKQITGKTPMQYRDAVLSRDQETEEDEKN